MNVGGPERDLEFEALFDGVFLAARRVARRIVGDPAAAEDIAAEALARTFARWKHVRELPYREAWVLRVTTNLAIDHARRRRPSAEPELARAAADDIIAVRLALAAALSRLPRRQREAVALRYLGDLTEQDVAAALGISAGSVKTHVHRGLAALRERLGPTFQEAELGTDA